MNFKISRLAVAVLLMTSSFALPLRAMRLKPPPPSGFAEGELEKLSSAEARERILNRLRNSDNEEYYEGLVYRLRVLGGIDVEDGVIVDALKEFVTVQLSREQAVPESTVRAISSALTIIGTRGTSQDVPFLKDILLSKSQTTLVSIQGDVGWGRQRVRDAAIRALALTGEPTAEKILMDFKGKVKAEGVDKYIRARIDREIEDNRKVRKSGVRSVLDLKDK